MNHLSESCLSRVNVFKQTLIKFNDNISETEESVVICKSVQCLLSSLQSISKRHSIENTYPLLTDQSLNTPLVQCLSKLEKIIFSDNCFAETTVLSGLAIAFILNIYLCDIRKAIHIYFKLFSNQTIIQIKFSDYEIDNNLSLVLDNCLSTNHLSKVSLINGLINCNNFVLYLIEYETKVFIQIHSHITKLCSQQLVHEFHVFRLLQHWFRTLKNFIKQIVNKEPNLLDDKSFLENSLDQIDNNWEHPINGVNDCIKIIYNLLLETYIDYKRIKRLSSEDSSIKDSEDLISEELVRTLRLSLTSKAKYRKLSALIQFSGWKSVLELEPNLSAQMLKYLSINSISSSITELYKSIVTSMKTDESKEILTIWSHYWLTHICDALKSQNKVIHNNMIAHILPFTLKNIEHSSELIFANISDSAIAEAALVRVSIDNKLANHLLPPREWIKKILTHNQEAVREEGLSLLIDGRYISDRQKIYDLFKLFLLTNLNIDNASFRQKIVSKIEHFLTKICISLRDKFALHGFHDYYDNKSVEFLAEYIDSISSNLIPGASYQRRTTCLLLLESLIIIFDKNKIKFENYINSKAMHSLILISVVDKDDKVRKLASNVLIMFYNNNRSNQFNIECDTIADIGTKFLDSPRHQESHSGGLLMKFLINNFNAFTINGVKVDNELDFITYLVESAEKQFERAQQNLLIAAKVFPIHGYILALNNCLSYDYLSKYSTEDQFSMVISDCILLCLNCINFMLNQLSQTNIESSPSFQEMCESLEDIIIQQISEKDKESNSDISTSNDFQLLLSMCWLNIKECTFLLSNLVELSEKFTQNIISDTNIHQIGSQLVSVLIKCRHKGVIEASCIALTRYTTSLIKMKTRNIEHIETLKKLLTDSLNCMTTSAFTSSITRRSAGLALIIQAILIGESEAYNSGFQLDISLFSQTVDKLIIIANSELPQVLNVKSDLPQTYALHILKSIICTASLSRFTTKTVEFLLPICIKGFISEVWQIRNASLQLFGSCCCRMLGQPKMTHIDQIVSDCSTITPYELFSRYPTLLPALNMQFEESFTKMNEGFICPELVPILSLLASISPIGLSHTISDEQLIHLLIKLLSNKIWKIRMLSAKALSNLLPINELQNILFELCKQKNMNCNSLHGLMLAVSHLLDLKKQLQINDYQLMKDRFCYVFNELIDSNINCKVLKDIYNEIFYSICFNYDEQELDNDNKVKEITFTNHNFDQFLERIHSNIQFKNSDDIRLLAAKTLNRDIYELKERLKICESSTFIFKLIEILLIILEDEDRAVRLEAENIVRKLINENNSCLSSFNVATDQLLIWFIENPYIDANQLITFLWLKLESVIHLKEIFRLQEINRNILFEKEEKNVFAEPLFLLFKVSKCLKILISKKSMQLTDESLKRLVNDCRYCLEHKSILEFENAIHFSIWKLPKLFLCISGLFLRIDLILRFLNCNSSETNNICLLKDLTQNLQISDAITDSTNIYQKTNFTYELSSIEISILSDTIKLLNSKFPYFSIIERNILSGYSLFNYQI